MLTADMTPLERFRDHDRTTSRLRRILEERIEANMELARRKPTMAWYYVQVARLQNTWLRTERRHLRNLATGAGVELDRPPRKPYRAKRSGERSSPPVLTPLAVALADPVPSMPQPAAQPISEPLPWPTGPIVQHALFGDMES